MKKIVLLLLALLTGCAIFMFVYNQRKNAELAQKLDNLSEEVINDIEETREELAEDGNDEDEMIDDLNDGMKKIKNDYLKSTGEEMPEDIEDAIEDGLISEAVEEKE